MDMVIRVKKLSLLAVVTVLVVSVWFASGADAKRLKVSGGGFGHGIGMSQYGAYGFAKQGTKYPEILAHYYTGTKLEKKTNGQSVKVLLQSSVGAVSFSGATKIGSKKANPQTTYTAVAAGPGKVQVTIAVSGRNFSLLKAPFNVKGKGSKITLKGSADNGVNSGVYRGKLQIRNTGSMRLNAINVVSLENYLKGVIPGEMPASWHQEALRVQAVAARTYAITTDVSGDGYNLYSDTRSQVYKGLSAEQSTTNKAVADTAGEVVTYQGEPVVTYFFSTSGGRTENVENIFSGSDPKPWLKSVDDPYDDLSPKHRWSFSFTMAQVKSKLGSRLKGSFKRIKVLKRGQSPRVVKARIEGTRGSTTATGPELRTAFGLPDSWAYYKVVK